MMWDDVPLDVREPELALMLKDETQYVMGAETKKWAFIEIRVK